MSSNKTLFTQIGRRLTGPSLPNSGLYHWLRLSFLDSTKDSFLLLPKRVGALEKDEIKYRNNWHFLCTSSWNMNKTVVLLHWKGRGNLSIKRNDLFFSFLKPCNYWKCWGLWEASKISPEWLMGQGGREQLTTKNRAEILCLGLFARSLWNKGKGKLATAIILNNFDNDSNTIIIITTTL